MKPIERYRAVIHGERPDIIPRVPILMQFAAEYIGSNYAAFASDHRVLVESNIRCARDFDFDQVSCISDPYRETAGFGGEIVFPKNGVPQCLAPPLADTDDLGVLSIPDPELSPRMKDRVDAVRLFHEQGQGEYSILGWVEGPGALAADVRGLQEFFMDLIEEPDWCDELMTLCTEASMKFAEAQIRAGADTIGVGDAMCSQVSRELYEQRILPHEKRLVDHIHALGGWVRLHICGQTKHLWDGIHSLGVDLIDCDSMVCLPEIRKALGPDVVLTGNLNPVAGVLRSTPQQIRDEVKRCAVEAGPAFMIGAGCEIPPGTPNENLKALCEPIAAT